MIIKVRKKRICKECKPSDKTALKSLQPLFFIPNFASDQILRVEYPWRQNFDLLARKRKIGQKFALCRNKFVNKIYLTEHLIRGNDVTLITIKSAYTLVFFSLTTSYDPILRVRQVQFALFYWKFSYLLISFYYSDNVLLSIPGVLVRLIDFSNFLIRDLWGNVCSGIRLWKELLSLWRHNYRFCDQG